MSRALSSHHGFQCLEYQNQNDVRSPSAHDAVGESPTGPILLPVYTVNCRSLKISHSRCRPGTRWGRHLGCNGRDEGFHKGLYRNSFPIKLRGAGGKVYVPRTSHARPTGTYKLYVPRTSHARPIWDIHAESSEIRFSRFSGRVSLGLD
jgi:hypothetical protein